MERDFAGQAAVVTGAARGIGLETARLIAERGAAVSLWDMDGAAVAEAAARLAAVGHHVRAETVNVTDERGVLRARDAEPGKAARTFSSTTRASFPTRRSAPSTRRIGTASST